MSQDIIKKSVCQARVSLEQAAVVGYEEECGVELLLLYSNAHSELCSNMHLMSSTFWVIFELFREVLRGKNLLDDVYG